MAKVGQEYQIIFSQQYKNHHCMSIDMSKSIVIGDISKITFQYQTPCNTVCNLLLEKLSQLIK